MARTAIKSNFDSRNTQKYLPPSNVQSTYLSEVIANSGRSFPEFNQLKLLQHDRGNQKDLKFDFAGDIEIINRPSIAIVGTRNVTKSGASRATKLSKELVENGVTIVSGIANGVDTYALWAAIKNGGKAVGVIGTPIDKASPAPNKGLHQELYANHLLISQFPVGSKVYPSNFPSRNRLMAAISDGTAIIEASDSSGTLHQAVECQRLGRWLFLLKSLFDNPATSWPNKFLDYNKTVVVESVSDILRIFE